MRNEFRNINDFMCADWNVIKGTEKGNCDCGMLNSKTNTKTNWKR